MTASSDIAGSHWTLEAEDPVLDHRLWPRWAAASKSSAFLRRPRILLQQGPRLSPLCRGAAAPAGAAALALRIVEARMDAAGSR